MTTNEKYEYLAYPGVYTDENEIIPYSPRRKFGFVSDMSYDKTDEYLAYPGVYTDENEIIPYSPRRKFGFVSDMSYDKTDESLAYPGVYTDENEIIPYSPRRKFGFVSDMSYDKTEEFLDKSKIINIESMEHISIDQIVQMYKYGYRIEDTSPTIEAAQEGIYISTGALLLGVGIIALIYYLKTKGKL